MLKINLKNYGSIRDKRTDCFAGDNFFFEGSKSTDDIEIFCSCELVATSLIFECVFVICVNSVSNDFKSS